MMHVCGPEKIGTASSVPMHAPSSLKAPLSANELVCPGAHWLSRAYQVDRTVNPMRDDNATAEPASILDLNGDVREPVAIKVADLVDRI
jgi:hypothetical protein